MFTSFPADYCYVVVDLKTGFAKVLDIWDGLMMAEFDSLDEALEYLNEG